MFTKCWIGLIKQQPSRKSNVLKFMSLLVLTQITKSIPLALAKLPDSTSTEYSVTGPTSSVSTGISNDNRYTNNVGSQTTNFVQKSTVDLFIPPAVASIPKLQKRAGELTETSISKQINTVDGNNHSREALTHDSSNGDPVYLSELAGYIPITSLRGRPPGTISHPSSAPGYGSSIDLEDSNWTPDPWDQDYTAKRFRFNTIRVQHIEAECQDDYMKIRIGFNGSFSGLLYSAGYANTVGCMYINGSGRDYYEFFIQLNGCGTLGKNSIHEKSRENPTKNFMWNTITVQYNPLIEEEFDEHFKVTCEYGYDFWKTVTFPFLEVEVATGNPVVFTLSPPECYMEIRNGYGVGGNRVTGPVRVGDPLTLIIYMRSKYDGFDIVVNDCYAHNGAHKRLQLIDEYGCPVDNKLISRFRGNWSDIGVYETKVFAYMKTFRFTGSEALYIECDVRMCHGRCPSQPCHWRNYKTVTKRDISNINYTNKTKSENGTDEAITLSDNVSLFQSLRVLQEDDEPTFHDDDAGSVKNTQEQSETCIKTSILSSIIAGFCITVCMLTGSLMVMCAKIRYRKKDSDVYEAYVNHKGQID